MNWILPAFLGALLAALGTIFAKFGFSKSIDSNLLTTIRGLVMALSVFIFGVVLGKVNTVSLRTLDTRTWIFVVLSGLCGALSWLLFYYALSIGPAGGVSAVDKLSIVITIVLAGLVLGESTSLQTILGALLIGVGAVLVALPFDKIISIFKL